MMLHRQEIKDIIEKIKRGARASALEGEMLEIKRYPARDEEPARSKLKRILEDNSVMFANTKGGLIILGIEDNVTGPSAFTGCMNYDINEMKRMIFTNTHPPIAVEIYEINIGGATLLAVWVPQSSTRHSNSDGVQYKRVGRDKRIIYPEDEAALRVEKGKDYTASPVYETSIDDVDPVEVARLKNWLNKYKPGNDFSHLDDEKLLKNLGLLIENKEGVTPTLACLLLVGKEETLKQKIPQCETIFLRFDKDDTTPTKSLYMKTPLLKTIDQVWTMIEPHNQVSTIKDMFIETEIPSFPEPVIREGLLNAYAHRDYTDNNSIYVRLYADKIEVTNPGGFVGDVTPDNILTHPPVRRNPLLAEAFQHIGAVNRAGLGVDRMFETLLSYGKTPPIYHAYKDSIVLIINDGNIDEDMARFVGRKAKEGHGWRVQELIILHYLRKNDRIDTPEASTLCQISKREAAELLNAMEGHFLERHGTGRGVNYQYTKDMFHALGERTKYTRLVGLSEERMLELILAHLEENNRVTNSDVQQICGIGRGQSQRLLKKLVGQDKIIMHGTKKGTYYSKRK